MKEIISTIKNCGAAECAVIPYKFCDVINKNIENRLQFVPQSVIIGTVPYYTHFCDQPRTVSAYAIARDYHILLSNICTEAVNELKKLYPKASFAAFGDHSPINEKIAAAKAGLGIIGDNSLLITENHSSFVFLFEILTDIFIEAIPQEVKYCEHCGACKKRCLADITDKKTCLSALTQKKGELSEYESKMISRSRCAWGCDICQLACPHTKKAIESGTIYTDSSWFNSHILLTPSEQTINNSEDFALRAYSWRGPQTILRNLKLINDKEETE